MTSDNTDAVNSREFLIRVEDALDRLDVSGDRRVIPTIAASFCDLLHESLTASQKMALAAAHRYLSSGESDEADQWINDLATRVGRPYPPETDPQAIQRERLLWVALNRNGDLTVETIGLLLWTGKAAGLSFEQMRHVMTNDLSSVVPI